ncbi:MAG: FadR family transcriptional regulator [Melioribacteraceae bacterium]|nr:FadR family transcriptional regulator [Melioribacteraceae bacterium]MCF8264977.1 FadR family transcriptional regulator [Melioribacteraceae bacterium]MCF8413083.1 FadR family transcriptional regulator [Melioribacteraceae bacterium]MCF8431630.1 FadR family transcriptional regulator [Melioribacteraceae bacterium]
MFNSVGERLPIKQIIASQIEDAILTGVFAPGEKIPSENQLCAQFSVSRTSVREAVQILATHGLVTVEKGRGIFVNKITSESVVNPMEKYLRHSLDEGYVMDLVHARQIIEPSIAREAALNHDDSDIFLLEASIESLRTEELDYIKLASIDMAFHFHLANASKNSVVPLLLKPIHMLLPEIQSKVYQTVEDGKDSAIIWHTKILDAVKQRNGDLAFQNMVEHLKISEKHVAKIVSNS